jgi:hypothetical protein
MGLPLFDQLHSVARCILRVTATCQRRQMPHAHGSIAAPRENVDALLVHVRLAQTRALMLSMPHHCQR